MNITVQEYLQACSDLRDQYEQLVVNSEIGKAIHTMCIGDDMDTIHIIIIIIDCCIKHGEFNANDSMSKAVIEKIIQTMNDLGDAYNNREAALKILNSHISK